MDQVKEQLALVLKYGFWIGSVVVLAGSIGVWYMSTSDLTSQTDSQIRKIEGDVSEVSTLQGELSTQPNDLSHARMNSMIDGRKQEVLAAWQKVFDAQRQILKWPAKLQDEFLDEFKYAKDPETGKVDKNKLKLPFEKYENWPPSADPDPVNPSLLRRYEQYIGEVLPEYAAIAGTEWTADFSKSRSMGMMMDDFGMDEMMGATSGMRRSTTKVGISGAVEEPVVVWSTASQDAVLKDMFPWKGVKEYPTELDVYYSQENLWILGQLLEIISAVNGDAKQSFEAEIREIKKLSIGRSVDFDQGNISDPGSRVQAGFAMGGYDMDMEMEMGGAYEGEAGFTSGPGMGEDEGDDPGDGRYVNTAFEPIDASSLRGAFASNDPGQVAIAVAKRVPVMLQLTMNQQSVPKLLAACGSAPLMVDVYQVRMIPKGMGGAAMGGDMGMMGMEDEMMGGMGDMGGMGGGTIVSNDEEFPMDMDIEVYGLIYFWNPPNEESLGIDKVTDDVSIDESAEVIDDLPGPAATAPSTTAPNTTATPPAATPDGTSTPAAPATGAGAPNDTAPSTTAPNPTAPTPTTPNPTTPPATAPVGGSDAAAPTAPPAAAILPRTAP